MVPCFRGLLERSEFIGLEIARQYIFQVCFSKGL